MADELIQQPTETTATAVEQTQQIDHSAELAAQMAISLNGGMEPQAAAQVSTDTSVDGQPAATVVTEQSVNDPFGIFKDKFGYDTPETAIKEIEELRAFKAQPRAPEFQVADDESGAILRALAEGKREEVWQILDRDIRINRLIGAEVTRDNAPDIVKMGMQLKYKDLTPEEINYRYNKQFSIPPKPSQLLDEDDTDYQQRVDAWQEVVTDKQTELIIEAKLAKPDIQNSKGKLEFPQIETPTDEGYNQYKQMLEQKTQNHTATVDAYKSFVPKAIETTLNFKDEANKIDFQFKFEPDTAKFTKAIEMACDQQQFWDLFKKPDGSPDRERFLDMICYAIDKDNYLLSAMNQAKNAAIKATLPDNTQGGLIRQTTQHQEPNELDQQMRNSLKGYGGY